MDERSHRVIRQALSRSAAERRIAAARSVDPETRRLLAIQAREYEEVLTELPPPDDTRRGLLPPAPEKRTFASH